MRIMPNNKSQNFKGVFYHGEQPKDVQRYIRKHFSKQVA